MNSFVLLAVCAAFGPKDSGSPESPRVIEGEVFSAAVELAGWTDDGDGAWSCPAAEWTEQLWINGRRAERCAWPKGRALQPVACGEQTIVSSNATGVVCRDTCCFADERVAALLGTVAKEDLPFVHLHVRNAWAFTQEGVVDIDVSGPTQRVTGVSTRSWSGWQPWSKTVLATFENVRSAFTEKGEWFFDGPARRIRYRPLDGERLGTLVARTAKRGVRQALAVTGDPDRGKLVHDLVFRNCTFECSDAMDEGGSPNGLSQQYQYQAAVNNDGLVQLTGATRIRFEGCTFRHSGNHGLRIGDGTSFVTVTNCVFTDIGAGGVWAGARKGYVAAGETLSRRKITTHAPRSVHHIVVDDCTLKGLGRVNPEGCGVALSHCSDSRVTHCEISDLYYTGVSVGWTWGWKGSVSQRNEISFNRIHDYGQGRMADMGGVYLLGTSFGTCVSNNVVHGVRCTRYGGWGLYTDQASEGIVMENNLVYDTDDASFSQHYGVGNHIRNNIFAWNRRDGALRCERLEADDVPNTFMFYNNIILTRDSPIMHQDHWPVDCLHANNVYWDAVRRDRAEFNGNSETKLDFAAWRQKANDRGSVLADPLFADAAANNFTLRPDSPALKLGFRPFDVSRAGRRGGSDK